MNNVKPAPDADTSDKTAIAGAVALLTEAARRDEAGVKALLAAGGFEIAGFVGTRKPRTETSRLDTIGQLIDGIGIHLGSWSFDSKYDPVAIYSADDFLRDRSGKQLVLNVKEAVNELTRRNHGRRYGNGTVAALRQALREGKYQDGDLVLAPRETLNGYDARGTHVRPDNNVYDLLRTSPAFEKLLNAVNSSSGDGRWSVSGSGHPDVSSAVWHALLKDDVADGNPSGYTTVVDRSGVVPARMFRRTSSYPGPTG